MFFIVFILRVDIMKLDFYIKEIYDKYMTDIRTNYLIYKN